MIIQEEQVGQAGLTGPMIFSVKWMKDLIMPDHIDLILWEHMNLNDKK